MATAADMNCIGDADKDVTVNRVAAVAFVQTDAHTTKTAVVMDIVAADDVAPTAPVTCRVEHRKIRLQTGMMDVGADIFERGLCLPSDNKMAPEQQDAIIEVIRKCFE